MKEVVAKVAAKAAHIVADGKISLEGKSPKLLVCAGITVMVAGAVVAITKTADNKVNDILDEAAEQIEDDKKYDEAKERGMRLTKTYVRTGARIVRHYALPIALEVTGAGLILYGYKLINGRYVAAVGMYKALDEYHKNYIERVKNAVGEEAEKRIRNGITVEEEEIEKDYGDGVVKTITHEKRSQDPRALGYFDVIFDEVNCSAWTSDPLYNRQFLTHVLNQANDDLDKRGNLLIWDIYEAIGYKFRFDKETAAKISGWTKPVDKEGNYVGEHDGYVSFGIEPDLAVSNPALSAFLYSNTEPNVVLRFNVDGPIIGEGLPTLESIRRTIHE